MTIPGSPPRNLLILFLAVTLGPACGLVFLAWQLLQQDRALAVQRLMEAREHTTDISVATLVQTLAAVERQLAEDHWTPKAGALLVTIREGGITNVAGGSLIFQARPVALPEAPREIFAAGEAAEFRSLLPLDAGIHYRALTKHGNPAVRAGAWMRIGRVERKANRVDAALAAYRQAAAITGAGFAGVPVDLAARRAACAILAASGRREDLRSAAMDLARDLFTGRWRLDHAQYETHAAEAVEWCACPRPAESEVLTTATLLFAASTADHRASGRVTTGLTTILWQRQGDQLRALVAGQDYVKREWVDPIAKQHFAQIWIGEGAEKEEAIYRASGKTGLPWPVAVALVSPERVLSSLSGRRRLLLTALVLIIILAVAGSYVVARAVSRELAVARLQSDFVSAVSHEFRTPLTALGQVAEVLAENRVPEGRRETYHATLIRATGRLQRLVEQLLDFGRMEAGVAPYRLQPVQAGEVAASVVKEFRQEVERRGYSVECTSADSSTVLADRQALGTALWNLLDNAVKYSGDSRTVWLEVVPEGDSVLFHVRDIGLGIDPAEQRVIFRKFVRGEESKIAGIKGTGIGLAMVTHIIQGHKGAVTLDSQPGRGSTFTIRLPRCGRRMSIK